MKARILKSMIIDGRKVVAGDIMEVKGWLHAKKLANNRYIEFIEETIKEPKPKVEESKAEEKVESKPKAPKKKDAE